MGYYNVRNMVVFKIIYNLLAVQFKLCKNLEIKIHLMVLANMFFGLKKKINIMYGVLFQQI